MKIKQGDLVSVNNTMFGMSHSYEWYGIVQTEHHRLRGSAMGVVKLTYVSHPLPGYTEGAHIRVPVDRLERISPLKMLAEATTGSPDVGQ